MRMFLSNDDPTSTQDAAGYPAAPLPATLPVPRRDAHLRLVPSELDQLLWLPDSIVRGLAEDFVASLPANVQRVVRARRAG